MSEPNHEPGPRPDPDRPRPGDKPPDDPEVPPMNPVKPEGEPASRASKIFAFSEEQP